MSTVKTYMLVPHHDFPAFSGPLALGSIIEDPLEPGESLNEQERVYIPVATIHTMHLYDWEQTVESLKDGRVGVWAHCVNLLGLGVGGSMGGSFDKSVTYNYRFQDLETTYFQPDQEYVEKAVNTSGVRGYIEGGSYKLPVYMVTGLKIVRGAGSQVTTRKSSGSEAHASGSVSGFFAVDNRNVGLHQTGSEHTSFRGSNFVIGYRLNRITFQKNYAGKVEITENKKYTAGAVLGSKDSRPRDASKSTIPAKVVLEGEEAVAEELSDKDCVMVFDEEDGKKCKCFIVPKSNNK